MKQENTYINILFGGGGFIGTNIYNNLIDKNNYFLVIDKVFDTYNNIILKEQNKIFKKNIQSLSKDLVSHTLEIRSIEKHIDDFIIEVSQNRKNIKINFYHLASTVGVKNNLKSNFSSEMIITQNIISIIKNVQLKILQLDLNKKENISINKIWYTSTSELFGNNSSQLDPKLSYGDLDYYKDLSSLYSLENPDRSHYIYQKYLGEKLFVDLGNWFKKFNNSLNSFPDIEILFLFNVVGLFQDKEKGVFNKFLFNILNGIVCDVSNTTRRYIPINYVTNFIKSKNLGYKKSSSNLLCGSDKYFTGSGAELFKMIKFALLEFYPEYSKYINESKIRYNYSLKTKEIVSRFDSNFHNYSYYSFLLLYGKQIREQVEFWSKNNCLKIPYTEEKQDVKFRIYKIENKIGLVQLEYNSDKDYNGYLLETINKDKILISKNHSDNLLYGVILGKSISVELIGTYCNLLEKLKLPNGEDNE